MDCYEHERRNREENGSSAPTAKCSKQYTPGSFVTSLQPLWDEGEGTATNLELRLHRNLEPGQPQKSTAFCSAAQAQAEVETPFPRAGTVGILPVLPAPALTQTLGVPPLPRVSLVMSEDHKELNFGKQVPSAAQHWRMMSHAAVSLAVPFYITSAHLPSKVIQFITAPSQSARLATEQLTDSKCPTTFHTALQKSCEKNSHSPLG